jgi:nuclear pore complex protein Nup205
MEAISHLRATLLASLSGRAGPHGEQELFEELMVCQSSLLSLFNVGPRSQAEQREVEAGAYYFLLYASLYA